MEIEWGIGAFLPQVAILVTKTLSLICLCVNPGGFASGFSYFELGIFGLLQIVIGLDDCGGRG